MKKIPVLACSLLLAIYAPISGCFEKCDCGQSEGLAYLLVGFSDAESDTIIVRKFSKATNFARPLDSTLLTNALINFRRQNDTLTVASQAGNNNLQSSFDYELYFPASGSLYRVTDIDEEQIRTNCGGLFGRNKDFCSNPIRSYRINGQLSTGSGNHLFVVLKK